MDKLEIKLKWEETRLLENQSTEEEKIELALLLEELCGYLNARSVTGEITPYNEFLNSSLLSALAIIYNDRNKKSVMPDVCWLILDFEKYLKDNNILSLNLTKSVNALDIDPQIVVEYCKNVVNRI